LTPGSIAFTHRFAKIDATSERAGARLTASFAAVRSALMPPLIKPPAQHLDIPAARPLARPDG
jgi:hypothetical protein